MRCTAVQAVGGRVLVGLATDLDAEIRLVVAHICIVRLDMGSPEARMAEAVAMPAMAEPMAEPMAEAVAARVARVAESQQ